MHQIIASEKLMSRSIRHLYAQIAEGDVSNQLPEKWQPELKLQIGIHFLDMAINWMRMESGELLYVAFSSDVCVCEFVCL